MSEDNSAYTVTLKGGKGYEDSWIVVRGNSVADMRAKLNEIGDVVAGTVGAASLFHGANNAGPLLPQAPQAAPVQQAAPGWATQAPAQAAPQQQYAPPVQNGPALHPTDTCQVCSQRPQEKDVYRKSDNKKFEFWACPNQKNKDDGHYSAFRN